jgi:gas vesicle protein
MMSENRCCYWLQGLFIGGLVGVVVGILFAPKSGKETRQEIGDKATDLAVRVKDEAEEKAKIGTQWFLRAFPVSEDLKGGVE